MTRNGKRAARGVVSRPGTPAYTDRAWQARLRSQRPSLLGQIPATPHRASRHRQRRTAVPQPLRNREGSEAWRRTGTTHRSRPSVQYGPRSQSGAPGMAGAASPSVDSLSGRQIQSPRHRSGLDRRARGDGTASTEQGTYRQGFIIERDRRHRLRNGGHPRSEGPSNHWTHILLHGGLGRLRPAVRCVRVGDPRAVRSGRVPV